MAMAVALLVLVVGTVLFHFLSPWWFTPIASNWKMMDDTVNITFVVTGIVFVVQSGIPWEMLPQEMGCGCGMTCWRRLRSWQRRGVWKKLLHALLQRVGQEEGIDWEHCCVDSQTFRAVLGGS